MPLERAVRKLTGEPADMFGFVRRGYLREGYWGDVCVFDPATVAPGPTTRLRDFPAGGERLTAEQPSGIRHVLVNGRPIRVDEVQLDVLAPALPVCGPKSDPERHPPMRPLPELTPWNEWFWTSGADGRLRIQGCSDCGTFVHPPVPICPVCRSRSSDPTRGLRSGHRCRVHRQPAPVASRPPPALRHRRGGPGRGPGRASHHQHRRVRRRRRPHRTRGGRPVRAPRRRVAAHVRTDRGHHRGRARSSTPKRPVPRATDQRRAVRAPGRALRGGAVGPRSQAHGRPPVADRRRVPRSGGRRRVELSRTSTDCRPTRAPSGWG